jgi:hypothetical protein
MRGSAAIEANNESEFVPDPRSYICPPVPWPGGGPDFVRTAQGRPSVQATPAPSDHAQGSPKGPNQLAVAEKYSALNRST